MKNRDLNIKINDISPADLAAVLELNQDALPEVSSLTMAEMKTLKEQCSYFRVAHVDGKLAGFLMAMQKGRDYQSLNYRWFCKQFDNFVYIDRVIVAPDFRGCGIGKAFYNDVENYAREQGALLACEVNIVSPNPVSMKFHQTYGFAEVGQQDTEGGKKRVSLLTKKPQSAQKAA